MTRKQNRLLQKALTALAQIVGRSWTTLEHVQSMAQNLWSQEADDSEDHPCTRGCITCGLLFTLEPYFWGESQDLELCPGCGGDEVLHLGTVPFITEGDDGFYLEDDEQHVMGPFPDYEGTQGHLWEWFAAKEKPNGKEEGSEEDQEGGEEGHKENGEKESRRRRIKAQNHLRVVHDKEGDQEGCEERRSRKRRSSCRVGTQDEHGQKVQGKGPGKKSK